MYPIIILWAHPRSMSTAIERIMRERGDFDCLHEPFLHYYYRERTGRDFPYFNHNRDHPTSYAAIRDLILQHAESAPVFAKDMSYYVVPEILADPEFCQRARHCFLIRDPLRSILSYYRLDPGVSLTEVGIEAQWRHFEGLCELGIENNPVIEAEAVQADSAALMARFWQALGLDFRERALNWQPGEMPADWQYVQGWHRSIEASSGIRRVGVNEEAARRAEFDQLCRTAPWLDQYLQHHLPYYERLRAHSLTANAAAAG